MSHRYVQFHHQDYLCRLSLIQSEAAADPFSYPCSPRYVSSTASLADVVQHNRKIEKRWLVDFRKHISQVGMLLVICCMQTIERFNRFQGVFINCVVMVKVMLDEQTHLTEFRHKATKKSDVVHQPQY